MKKRNKKGYYTHNRNSGYSQTPVRTLMKVWRFLNANKVWLTKTDIAREIGLGNNVISTRLCLDSLIKIGVVKKTRGTGKEYFRKSNWYYQVKDFNGLSSAGGKKDVISDSQTVDSNNALEQVRSGDLSANKTEPDQHVHKKKLKPQLYNNDSGVNLPTSLGKRVTLYAMEHPKMSREELAKHFKYHEHSIHRLLKISGILRNKKADKPYGVTITVNSY